ncbi:MAG: hypothetical protein ACRC50_05790 [Gaiella sp.]
MRLLLVALLALALAVPAVAVAERGSSSSGTTTASATKQKHKQKRKQQRKRKGSAQHVAGATADRPGGAASRSDDGDDERELTGRVTAIDSGSLTVGALRCTLPAGAALPRLAVGDLVEITCDRSGSAWVLRTVHLEDQVGDDDADDRGGHGSDDDRSGSDDDDHDDDRSGSGGGSDDD